MAKSIDDKIIESAIPADKRIRAEYSRLLKIYAGAPAKQLNLAKKLIANAAFMAVLLDDLAREIANVGAVEDYQNGANQHGKKSSSELQSYNSTIKNYSSTIKQLNEMLGGAVETEDDPLAEFMASRK